MMKTSSFKTRLTRKAGMIAGGATTLATAMVLTMAPVSAAQAVGLRQVGSGQNPWEYKQSYIAEGGARGNVENAKADARKIAKCPSGWTKRGSSKESWQKTGRWKNWDWYYADLYFECTKPATF